MSDPHDWSEWSGIRTRYKLLIVLAVVIGSIVVYALIGHDAGPVCDGPGTGPAC